jgi:hypothetical protein
MKTVQISSKIVNSRAYCDLYIVVKLNSVVNCLFQMLKCFFQINFFIGNLRFSWWWRCQLSETLLSTCRSKWHYDKFCHVGCTLLFLRIYHHNYYAPKNSIIWPLNFCVLFLENVEGCMWANQVLVKCFFHL